jgi:hypothetical protein
MSTSKHPYIEVCPGCGKPCMVIRDHRPGQGGDEQSWYTCRKCLTEVYINVTVFDDEEHD